MIRPRRTGLPWLRLGLLVGVTLGGALAGGVFLDGWLGTRPIFTVVLALIAVHLTVALVYREFMAQIRRISPEDTTSTEEETQ